MHRTFFAAALLFLSAHPALSAGEIRYYVSPKTQNTFVELYTSDLNESCNSALAWMSSMHKKQPKGLWKDFVPIAMHVSYWDVPGGKDPFAREIFDGFLLKYRGLWNTARAHAPAVVVNGTEWGGWAHDRDVPPSLPKEVGVLSADGRKRSDHFLVEFIPSRKLDAKGLTVHAALLGFGVVSTPSEGGNRGRELTHDFVALKYMRQSFQLSYGVLTSDFDLNTRKTVRADKYAVVFWVTPGDDIRPIQATGGYLP